MRPLTVIEQSRLKLLTSNQISLTLIEPTRIGLEKSIMDATAQVRNYLEENKVHNYALQQQGQAHKARFNSKIYKEATVLPSVASMYRPETKKGDPRVWFKNLTEIAQPNDIIAIIYYESELHLFNLSKLNISKLLDTPLTNPLKELISAIRNDAAQISNELLLLLKQIAAKGPIPSIVDADTSVGRTLETELGIDINSSKKPDYKGIELKSFRGSRSNRKNLFAQVPAWEISKFKSSAQILDAFGYQRGSDFKLYCTVSAKIRNSQSLTLRMDQDIKQLIENSSKPDVGDFVIWPLKTLHARLLEKHRETFWVEAECSFIDGREYFQYKLVEHTKSPILSQFDLLMEQGVITLDHLIKRNSNGKVVEKGPLFKIKPKGVDMLFPPSEKHILI